MNSECPEEIMVLLALHPAQFRLCDLDSRGSKAGRGRKEEVNHEDLEDLKGASSFASSASGEDFFEVFEVFVVCFYFQCLNCRFRLASLALRG
jgi:hypothetical protein